AVALGAAAVRARGVVAGGGGDLDPLGGRARRGAAGRRDHRARRRRLRRGALAGVPGADRTRAGPLPRRTCAGAAVHRRLRRRRRAVRRVAGGAALRDPPGDPGGGDPDRIELADHLPEPVRGPHPDARTWTAGRDRGQRPAAHGARPAPVPPARHPRLRLADAAHALPSVPHALGVPRPRGVLLPPRPGGAAAVARGGALSWPRAGPHPRARIPPCASTAAASTTAPPSWCWPTTPRSTAATATRCWRCWPTTWSTTSTRARARPGARPSPRSWRAWTAATANSCATWWSWPPPTAPAPRPSTWSTASTSRRTRGCPRPAASATCCPAAPSSRSATAASPASPTTTTSRTGWLRYAERARRGGVRGRMSAAAGAVDRGRTVHAASVRDLATVPGLRARRAGPGDGLQHRGADRAPGRRPTGVGGRVRGRRAVQLELRDRRPRL